MRRAGAAVAERERRRGGARRLADPALAREQEQAGAGRGDERYPNGSRLAASCRRGTGGRGRGRRGREAHACRAALAQGPDERPKAGEPAGLRGQLGQEPDGTADEGLPNGRDGALLGRDSPAVDGPPGLADPGHAIHEDLVDREAAALEGLDGVLGLLDGQHLRQDHPAEAAAAGVAEERGQPASLGVDLGHEVVCRVAPVRAPKPRQEEVVLGEHLVQDRGDPAAASRARPGAGACARWAPCRRRPCRSGRPPQRP